MNQTDLWINLSKNSYCVFCKSLLDTTDQLAHKSCILTMANPIPNDNLISLIPDSIVKIVFKDHSSSDSDTGCLFPFYNMAFGRVITYFNNMLVLNVWFNFGFDLHGSYYIIEDQISYIQTETIIQINYYKNLN